MESQMRINPPIMDINKTSRRHADIWSHPGHYRVAPYTSPWSQKGHGHGHEWPPIVHCQLALLFLRGGCFKIWPWKSKIKVIAKVKPNDCICCLEFNRNRNKRLLFISWQLDHIWLRTWGMANFIFDRENFRSRPWPRSNLIVTFKA